MLNLKSALHFPFLESRLIPNSLQAHQDITSFLQNVRLTERFCSLSTKFPPFQKNQIFNTVVLGIVDFLKKIIQTNICLAKCQRHLSLKLELLIVQVLKKYSFLFCTLPLRTINGSHMVGKIFKCVCSLKYQNHTGR